MRFSPSAFLGALVLGAAAGASAETLRVPQDYTLIQRAVDAAAPGDTVEVAAGIYYGNVSISKPLTLNGAGSDKTTIIGFNRTFAALEAQSKGRINVRGFTVKHAPPNRDDSEGAGNGARFADGEVHVTDIKIEDPASEGMNFYSTHAFVENISIAGAPVRGLSITSIYPDSTFQKVRIVPVESTVAIDVDASAVTFSELTIEQSGTPIINVRGESSAPKFVGIPAALRANIQYVDGATAEGPKAPAEYGDRAYGERAEVAALHEKFGARRRALTRAVEKSLRSATTEEKHAAVLTEYFKQLSETLEGDVEDEDLANLENSELETFGRKYSPAAIVRAMPQFAPALKVDEDTVWNRVSNFLSLSATAEKNAAAERALFGDLPRLLGDWKQDKGTNPKEAARSFIAMLKVVTAKSESATDSLREKVSEKIGEQVQRYGEVHGVPGLNQLMRQLAGEDSLIVGSDNVRFMLSDDQRNAFIRWLRTQK